MDANPESWAEMEFGACELGDHRRTRRLVKVGAQALARPDGTSPEQTESWADCKALYRLMNCEDVSFEAIEEYHKALKTGCRVEARYFETARRLERVTGLLAIVAVQLLRLRSLAEQNPERPADEVVPRDWVRTPAQVRRRPTDETMTISQFVKHLGGLGGHLGRKGDGRPGWITLWRGLEKLLLILRGTHAAKQRCG